MDHARIGDDCHVATLALDIGHSVGDDIILFGHVSLNPVEHLVLDEHNRVVVADGSLEQSLGIVGSAGHDDIDAGKVGPQRLETLGVVGSDAPPRASLGPDHHGHGSLAAKHEAVLGPLVGDLVHC